MSGLRKVLSLLALLLLAGCSIFLLGEKKMTSLFSVIRSGWDETQYEAVSAGGGGVCAAASLKDGTLRLSYFTGDGDRLGEQSFPLENEYGGTVSSLYCFQQDLSFLAAYDLNANYLTIYRVSEAGANHLLRLPCAGVTYDQRRDSARVLGISQVGDRISITVSVGGAVQTYACSAQSGGLKEAAVPGEEAVLPFGPALTAAVLPDGSLALGGAGALVINGIPTQAAAQGQLVTHLVRRNAALYYVDAADMSVWHSSLSGTEPRLLLNLDDSMRGRTITDLSFTSGGESLLLLDNRSLVVVGEEGSRELSGILFPSRSSCVGTILIYAIVALGAVLLVWYAFCQLQVALAFYWGCCLISLTLASILILKYAAIRPTEEQLNMNYNRNTTEAVVRLALRNRSLSDPLLCDEVGQALGSEDHGNATVSAARLTAGGWFLHDGSRAELDPFFDINMAGHAVWRGSDCVQEGKFFRYTYALEDWTICVTMNRSTDKLLPETSLFFTLMLIVAAALLILLRINGDVRLLATEVERVGAGTDDIRLRTGDELQGISSALSGLSAAIARQMEERENIERAYRRFVPERVLNLLGKRTIDQVDKNTFTTGRMSVMKVWFTFPEQMYAGSADNRVLFNSINEVIERTASIAERCGGTVFNFAHDGYEVVMGQDAAQLVSTAVSMEQEVISLNRSRVERNLPEVTFRMALDVGNVMIGIVGDSEQMEPTAISSSFSTVRMLIRLAEQLSAAILCTEAIAGGAQGYGFRYLGRAPGETPLRVYEIFDADEYDVRKGKTATVKRFSQGVFALYSGDLTTAKHIFLELAHDYPGDGAVRYYLYLVDRMEEDPETPCELNAGKER